MSDVCLVKVDGKNYLPIEKMLEKITETLKNYVKVLRRRGNGPGNKIEALESIKTVLIKLKSQCKARKQTSLCPILESLEINNPDKRVRG